MQRQASLIYILNYFDSDYKIRNQVVKILACFLLDILENLLTFVFTTNVSMVSVISTFLIWFPSWYFSTYQTFLRGYLFSESYAHHSALKALVYFVLKEEFVYGISFLHQFVTSHICHNCRIIPFKRARFQYYIDKLSTFFWFKQCLYLGNGVQMRDVSPCVTGNSTAT